MIRLSYVAAVAHTLPLLMWNGAVQQFNASVSDALLRMRGSIHSPSVDEVVLLAIDDTTLNRYGPLPLRRATIADAIRRVAEFRPRALVLDMLFAESGPSDDDLALASALSAVPAVVLGVAIESDNVQQPRWIVPLPELGGGHLVGHVHAEPDPDGNVRSVLLAKAAAGQRFWALGVQAVRVTRHTGAPVEERNAIQLGDLRIPASEAAGRMMRINYAGPEGTFRRISVAAILDGSAHPEDFSNRTVLLGVTAQGGGDRLFTPVSTGIGMSGIEIHANVLRTMLDRDFLIALNPTSEMVVGLVIAIACMIGVGALRGIPLFAALAGMAFTIPVLGGVALRFGSIWPVASFLAVLMLTSGIVGAGEYATVWLNLRTSESRRREYAYRVQAIAHEIKTPLTAIQGSSEIISDHLVPEAQRDIIAGMIHKESKRLTDILHTFLDVERMASGTLTIKKHAVELPALCEDVLERARLYAARKQIHIDSVLPSISVPADGELLSFAIYNLLTNAVKYSPKRTTVVLSESEEKGRVRISVTDQGSGIAPSEQRKIFDRFYRSVSNQPVKEEGTGIGLALVKEIVSQHDGRIEVDSREGTGSRFTIVLPSGDK
ncbi:MAG TPA: CHASE2 domain-containing protein [Candidatus Binatia bacterium]|nr:CHASE2 domain-containing protein [Candidatus Binatia bacterium]